MSVLLMLQYQSVPKLCHVNEHLTYVWTPCRSIKIYCALKNRIKWQNASYKHGLVNIINWLDLNRTRIKGRTRLHSDNHRKFFTTWQIKIFIQYRKSFDIDLQLNKTFFHSNVKMFWKWNCADTSLSFILNSPNLWIKYLSFSFLTRLFNKSFFCALKEKLCLKNSCEKLSRNFVLCRWNLSN